MKEANIEKDSRANFRPWNSETWCGERRKYCFLRKTLWKMVVFHITILALFLPLHPVWADSGSSAEGQGRQKTQPFNRKSIKVFFLKPILLQRTIDIQ